MLILLGLVLYHKLGEVAADLMTFKVLEFAVSSSGGSSIVLTVSLFPYHTLLECVFVCSVL